MLYSKIPHLPESTLVVQVHIPRTGGTSLRMLFNGLFGAGRCLMSYNGELEAMSAEELADVRFVAGHFGYGVHRFFPADRRPFYVSVTRDPVDRFLSTYAEFRTNTHSKYHPYATKYDVNDFLKLVLDTDVPGLWQQLHNLQCRLIAGEGNFEAARRYVDANYHLVAPLEAIEDMVSLLAASFGCERPRLPHVHDTRQGMAPYAALAHLTSASLDLLLSSESEDVLLHSYVQKAFTAVREAADLPTGGNHVEARSPVSEAPAASTGQAACNICGGTVFAPGPRGRLSASGLPPRCAGCDSLERHRIVSRLFQAFPVGFLDWRRALQFSHDQGVDGRWFRSFEVSVFGGDNSLDLQAVARPDGSFDFLSLNHVLESVPDDRLAFAELDRILSPNGMMQICFGSVGEQAVTEEFAEPQFEWKAYRHYGRDVLTRLGGRELGLTPLVVEEGDPSTGVREMVHLFFKSPAEALRARAWLGAWSNTVRFWD